jgi:ureidoacrylate peracid hydrolase
MGETKEYSRTESFSSAESLRFDPQNAVVMIIDLQNDFCHPDGLMSRLGQDVSSIEAAMEKLFTFLSAARTVNVPLLFIRTEHSTETDTAMWLNRGSDPDREQSCQSGSWGAEFWKVKPKETDEVIVKNRYSAFTQEETSRTLTKLGRRSLLFVGVSTGMCVESSLREAVCRDYLTTLVSDCCADYSQSSHENALQAIGNGHGLVTTSERITRSWSVTQ